MDWENERYVRVYIRDSSDLLVVGPIGRAVFWELLRKVDRAGVIETKGDLEVMPELLRVPMEWWEYALPKLVKRELIEVTDKAIVIPNYLEAQEAKSSDKQRQRDSRERRRAKTLKKESVNESQPVTSVDDSVTKCRKTSEPVTVRPAVTGGVDIAGQNVTPSLAEPCLAEPSLADINVRSGAKAPCTLKAKANNDKEEKTKEKKTNKEKKISKEEFELVYKKYPKKTGKVKGLERARAAIRTREEFELFDRCVTAMSRAWKAAPPDEQKYCRGFEVFVNNKSWLDDDWPMPSGSSRLREEIRSQRPSTADKKD